MNIGVCDDNAAIVDSLEKIILQGSYVENCHIYKYTDPLSLISDCEKMDLCFLDIDMPMMNGYEVGKRIRTKNKKCLIVMATGMTDSYKEAFKVGAHRFVTKPFNNKEVWEAISSAITKEKEKSLQLFFQREKYTVDERDIVFARACNGSTEYWVKNKFFRKEISLSEAEEELNSVRFIRINKGQIINMSYIEYYRAGEIRTENHSFRVSVRRRKEFEKRYVEFDIMGRLEI